MDNADLRDPHNGSEELFFDAQRLAQLGRSIVGEQTIQDFCQKTGLSRSLVSRLVNGTLKAPPRIRSIYRFAGDDAKLADQMLEACGYPSGAIAHMREIPALLRDAEKEPAVPAAPHLAECNYFGLALMLNGLTRGNYGTTFQIECGVDDTFALHLESNQTIVGIPAFCANEFQIEDVWRKALHTLAVALTKQNSSNTCYFLLTNSQQLYSKLKVTPNIDYRLAVLLTTDGRDFQSQYVIAPHIADEEEAKNWMKNFPVWIAPDDHSSL